MKTLNRFLSFVILMIFIFSCQSKEEKRKLEISGKAYSLFFSALLELREKDKTINFDSLLNNYKQLRARNVDSVLSYAYKFKEYSKLRIHRLEIAEDSLRKIQNRQSLSQEYRMIVLKFIDNIKNDKKELIAKSASYPLRRDCPIPDVKNKQEFINNYKAIFDDSLKQIIIKSNPITDWIDVRYHGIKLHHGDLWLDLDGNLIAVNYQSKSESNLQARLIEKEKKNIHHSLSHFYKPVCILETSTYRIRIDDLGENKYRYACWNIKDSMKEKPDLIIQGGEYIPDGSGGNIIYKFKYGEHTYECFIDVMEDKPSAALYIYKADKEILSQDAKIIRR